MVSLLFFQFTFPPRKHAMLASALSVTLQTPRCKASLGALGSKYSERGISGWVSDCETRTSKGLPKHREFKCTIKQKGTFHLLVFLCLWVEVVSKSGLAIPKLFCMGKWWFFNITWVSYLYPSVTLNWEWWSHLIDPFQHLEEDAGEAGVSEPQLGQLYATGGKDGEGGKKWPSTGEPLSSSDPRNAA